MESNIKDPKYIFWSDDLTVLYENDNYIKFIPTENMTRAEQLNAIARFCIYFALLAVLFDKEQKWLYVPIIILLFTIFLYKMYIGDEYGKEKDFKKKLEMRRNRINIKNEEDLT